MDDKTSEIHVLEYSQAVGELILAQADGDAARFRRVLMDRSDQDAGILHTVVTLTSVCLNLMVEMNGEDEWRDLLTQTLERIKFEQIVLAQGEGR